MEKIEKVLRINRVIYALLFILTAIPFIFPLGIPVPIDKTTKECYELIDSLEPGSIVLINSGFTVGMVDDLAPGIIAMMNHIFAKDLKLLVVDCRDGQAVLIFEEYFEKKVINAKGKEYGVDFANLGFVPGMESGMAALASDIKGVVPKDNFGNPTSELPIMDGVNGMNDIDFVIHAGDGIPLAVGQWKEPFGVKLIGFPNTMGVPSTTAYYTSGDLDGLLMGLSGGSQYESLIKIPGTGLVMLDAQTLTNLSIIMLIIIGNIIGLNERMRARV